MMTTTVAACVSLRFGQWTFLSSTQHSWRNSTERVTGCLIDSSAFMIVVTRVRQDSNLQPPDLESGALAVRATDPAGRLRRLSLLDLPLLVERVAPARRAELLERELVRRPLLVLGRRVVLP